MKHSILKIAIVATAVMMPNTMVTGSTAIADEPTIVQMEAIPVIPVQVSNLPVRPPEISADDLYYMTLNLYHEARGEDARGIVGVGWVVLNRKASKTYPDTIRGVVQQGGEKRRYKCQFSWWCDGKPDTVNNQAAWSALTVIAKALLRGEIKDPTRGSLNYHATYVTPYWSKSSKLKYTVQLGAHLFYRPNRG